MRKEEEIKEVRDLVANEKDELARLASKAGRDDSRYIAYLQRRWDEAHDRETILNWVLEQDSSARLNDDIYALRSQHRHEEEQKGKDSV